MTPVRSSRGPDGGSSGVGRARCSRVHAARSDAARRRLVLHCDSDSDHRPRRDVAGSAGRGRRRLRLAPAPRELVALRASRRLASTPRSRMATTESTWTPSSWRGLPAAQRPEWPDEAALTAVRERLARRCRRSCSRARRVRSWRRSARSATGRAFLLQAGDCVESFRDVSAPAIRERLKVLLQMSAVLAYGAMLPVVQSRPHRGSVREAAQRPDRGRRRRRAAVVSRPHRPLGRADAARRARPTPSASSRRYYQAASTLNLLRAFTKGGFADLTHVHTWNREFVASSPAGQRYEALAGRDRARAPLHAGDRDRPRRPSERSTRSTSGRATRASCSSTRRRSPARTRSPASRTTARRTCSGSATARASSAARTSSSSPASATRSA